MHHVGSLIHALHKVSDGLICLSYQYKAWRKFGSQSCVGSLETDGRSPGPRRGHPAVGMRAGL